MRLRSIACRRPRFLRARPHSRPRTFPERYPSYARRNRAVRAVRHERDRIRSEANRFRLAYRQRARILPHVACALVVGRDHATPFADELARHEEQRTAFRFRDRDRLCKRSRFRIDRPHQRLDHALCGRLLARQDDRGRRAHAQHLEHAPPDRRDVIGNVNGVLARSQLDGKHLALDGGMLRGVVDQVELRALYRELHARRLPGGIGDALWLPRRRFVQRDGQQVLELEHSRQVPAEWRRMPRAFDRPTAVEPFVD